MIKYIKAFKNSLSNSGKLVSDSIELALVKNENTVLKARLATLSNSQVTRLASENSRLRGMITNRQMVLRKLEVENISLCEYLRAPEIEKRRDYIAFIKDITALKDKLNDIDFHGHFHEAQLISSEGED